MVMENYGGGEKMQKGGKDGLLKSKNIWDILVNTAVQRFEVGINLERSLFCTCNYYYLLNLVHT